MAAMALRVSQRSLRDESGLDALRALLDQHADRSEVAADAVRRAVRGNSRVALDIVVEAIRDYWAGYEERSRRAMLRELAWGEGISTEDALLELLSVERSRGACMYVAASLRIKRREAEMSRVTAEIARRYPCPPRRRAGRAEESRK